jgi:hypothetical protein
MRSPGIYDIPESEYFASPAVSNSDLKLIARSPAHYYAAKLAPDKPEPKETPAMTLGKALHCAILEPDFLRARYCAAPADAPKDLRHHRDAKKPSDATLESIAWWDAFESENIGKTVLSSDDLDRVIEASNHILNHDELHRLLSGAGDCEQAVFAVDPETGVEVRCKPDRRSRMVTRQGEMLAMLDLKSTQDARPAAFQRTAFNFSYFRAAAWYSDVHAWAGLGNVDTFLLVAFETERPYAVKIYEVGPEELERGRREYRPLLNTYAECRANDAWPSYDTTIERIEYPRWALEE